MLRKNLFPTTLVDKWIKIFLNKQFAQKIEHTFYRTYILEHTFSKKELFIVLPYLRMSSLYLRTCLQKELMATFHFSKLQLFLNHQYN